MAPARYFCITACILTLLLFAQSCHDQPAAKSPAPQKAYPDSLSAYMTQTLNPMYRDRKIDQSGKLLDSLQPVVEKQHSILTHCTWLRFKGLQYIYESKPDSAEPFLRQALAIAQKEDSTQQLSIPVKLVLIDMLLLNNKIDSALIYSKDAYNIVNKSDSSNLASILLKLASVYAYVGDMEQYGKYSFEGFRTSIHLPKARLAFANCITSYYSGINKKDSAIEWYRNFSEKDTSMNTPYFRNVKFNNMAMMLTHQNRHEEALKYELMALELGRAAGLTYDATLLQIGISHLHLKHFREAEEFIDSAMKLAIRNNNPDLLTLAWKETANLYAAQRRFPEALTAKDSAQKSFERSVDSSLNSKAKEIETRYAVKSKDEEIQTLAITNEANRKISAQQKLIILILAGAFLMAGILGMALWRRRKLTEKLRQAELEQRLLRSQMEPHFIFNTLSVLQSFIRNNESEKAVRYLNQFARLLRVTLENSRESFVPLEDEIAALENYLSLQSMRFEGLFDYEVTTWPMYEDERLLIPPMLLQPFVENAILHGMKQLDHRGHIHVSIKKENHVLRCVIEDNGTGLQPATTLQPGKTSLSTTITQERLVILSRQTGYPAGISIANRPGDQPGTRVELSIPFRRAKPFPGSGEKANGF